MLDKTKYNASPTKSNESSNFYKKFRYNLLSKSVKASDQGERSFVRTQQSTDYSIIEAAINFRTKTPSR